MIWPDLNCIARAARIPSSNELRCFTLPRARLQRLDDQTVMPREAYLTAGITFKVLVEVGDPRFR